MVQELIFEEHHTQRRPYMKYDGLLVQTYHVQLLFVYDCPHVEPVTGYHQIFDHFKTISWSSD